MPARAEERKAEIIDGLAAQLSARLAADEAAVAERFARAYFRDVAPEDLAERDPLDLYGAALAQLRFSQERPPGQPRLRVYNPKLEQHGWQSTHTVVEIVNDDMPFLVDSVGMALSRHGLGVHLIIHPVLAVRRDADGHLLDLGAAGEIGDGRRESFMHFEVDRQTDPEVLTAIEENLRRVLNDVRHAVEDWRAMRDKVGEVVAELPGSGGAVPQEQREEAEAFLRWLADDHFTFLGYNLYQLEHDASGVQLRRVKGAGLGILRHPDDGDLSQSFRTLPAEIRARARQPAPLLTITKANARSTVHRATYLDFIGVKRFGADGAVIGEHRFMGLLTSVAYSISPHEIPLIDRKVQRVIERAGFGRAGHAGKALLNILENYPRDELLQTSEDDLFRIATGILQLQERQRLRLFLRSDPFGRFVSCLVFVPRDRFNTALRERMQHLLEQAVGATESEFQVWLSESSLARLLFTLRTPQGVPADLDTDHLEQRLVEVSRSWVVRLRDALLEAAGEERGNALFETYGRAFPASYQERLDARQAVPDVLSIDRLSSGTGGDLAMSLYRRLEDPADVLRFKLIRRDQQLLLSDVLPVLENMGLKVLTEEPSLIRAREGRLYSLHDFGLSPVVGDAAVDVDAVREHFQDLFLGVWSNRLENDGFNRLVLSAGLSPRQIVILRAYCKYMLQIGTPFSQAYVEQTLSSNPGLARELAHLFDVRFDPACEDGRTELQLGVEERLTEQLNQVASLDQDRILRRYLELFKATLRTNAWQRDAATGGAKDYVSFKFDPQQIPGLPAPRPTFEIFVYAPHMEGVHLRGGRVARGGLRWSDRREDFRTEILGLMKAQMVKNAVIVPVGAKGGFVVKRPPAGGDRAALQEEGVRCYRTLLRGMLDITDNRLPDGIVPPPDVVRYDGDDPYLVVAADKGTATFSDIANGVSRDYGFWLDDAFASGGSAGYDHKKMGITARGAWESVKRLFRELGLDPQADTFTAIGIGDMSGDVFGNGMLLSDKIKLVAAFDHRHVFLDPDPDPARSFAERRRLFELPRSSWDDYDRGLISAGGGIWPRTAKSIPLSPETRAVLAVEAEKLTPNELITAILKAPVDLFWNGGIGTYVKAAGETQADAQDRVNDAIRVDGEDLRCRVVAEGGNLGFTQKGRVAFALKGGRVNTDFIDNSAGVDCSDHEVNIKILLRAVLDAGDLTVKQRDELLEGMTDEVAELVLRDNVLQNLALSMTERLGLDLLDAQARLMRRLEGQNRLDRELEKLPGDGELAERRKAGHGLTRPEAAVLLAYAKMTLFEDLLRTDLPDRAYLARDVAHYFPRPLRERFAPEIEQHRLRREIVATWIANSVVNRGLDVFVSELEDETGGAIGDFLPAYVAARDSFDLPGLWGAIEAAPASVSGDQQTRLLVATRDVLLRGTRWFMTQGGRPFRIGDTVARFRPRIEVIMRNLPAVVSDAHAARLDQAAADLVAAGVEPALARTVASLPHLLAACDVVCVAPAMDDGAAEPDGPRLLDTARVYFALDSALDLPWLKGCVQAAPRRDRWDRLALTGLEDDLSGVLRGLTTAAVAAGAPGEDPAAATRSVCGWLDSNLQGLTRYRALTRELQQSPAPDLAMLAVAVRTLGELLPRGLKV